MRTSMMEKSIVERNLKAQGKTLAMNGNYFGNAGTDAGILDTTINPGDGAGGLTQHGGGSAGIGTAIALA